MTIWWIEYRLISLLRRDLKETFNTSILFSQEQKTHTTENEETYTFKLHRLL